MLARIGSAAVDGQPLDNQERFVFKQGELRTFFANGSMLAQWIQPATTGSQRLALPVDLHAASRYSWRGTISVLPHIQHLYLSIEKGPAGSLQAFVRNPEANLGAFFGVRTVFAHGSELRLHGSRGPDVVATVAADGTSINLPFKPLDTTLTLRRASGASAAAFFARTAVSHYVYREPSRDADAWRTGSLHDVGMNEHPIALLIDGILNPPSESVHTLQIQSLQIARHGRLVVDEYFYGFEAGRLHDTRSAAKSFTTLLLGNAIEHTQAVTPQSLVSPLFARYRPFAHNSSEKQRITLANLMTMSAGYACDDNDDASPGNEDTMQAQTAQPDWYKYTLDLPMAFAPGTNAAYCSAEINLLGGAISHVTGEWIPFYFYQRFGAPMQFGTYALPITPSPLSTAYMAGGDQLRPRDFLKFGELFLERGRWNHRQIVSERWLEECARPQPHEPSEGRYGYGWHLYSYRVANHTYRAISAGGNGGQLLIAVPDLDLAAVITAGNYGQYRVWRKIFTELVPRYIIPAAI